MSDPVPIRGEYTSPEHMCKEFLARYPGCDGAILILFDRKGDGCVHFDWMANPQELAFASVLVAREAIG